MFSDEKIFTRNGYFNPKNDAILADSRYEANEAGGYRESEKFPVYLMVGLTHVVRTGPKPSVNRGYILQKT
ncbi:unnamed protein product, partial [Rotaria magnacalcarata]